MRKNFILLALLGAVLALAVHSGSAAADECGDREPCEFGQPGLTEDGAFTGQQLAPGFSKKRQKQRRRIEIYSQPSYYEDDQFVQNNDTGENLIGETEALTQALAAVPDGKPLGVKLLKGPTPVYAVKLRVRGKVRRILVDARTAQVLGE
ncbi:MAG TPA: PepSY domain-containing protein [Aestuariivirgaceae bacterium]|jgi:peptidase YpeB-like protein|nr:PepSY domain-containing protein [Aestuariivirgaceae bacterium]